LMNDERGLHPSLERLSAFDSGLLHDAEWEEIERHVAHCTACCEELEALPEDQFASLLKASAGKSTVPPSCESKQTPPGAAISSVDTLPRRPKATPPEIPAELVAHPRYRILEFLGAGGMGTVFKAEHRLMERVVALKIIRKDLMDRPAALERFPQEVRAAARLVHPHIVTAYDADQAGNVHFLVMEYVEGKSLDRLLGQSAPLPVDQACDWIRQAALGLHHAWEQGMVHRDIKPGNLLLTPAGQIKILDFGLARFANEAVSAAGLTPEGSMIGTPDYMAPEQADAAGNADIRADIYSLGCTLYHLLAGEPPFPQGAPLHKLLFHQTRQPRLLTELRGDVPAELAEIVGRMLAKDPAQRYQTPAEVARELAPFVEGEWPTVPISKPGPVQRPAGEPTLRKAGLGKFSGRSWRMATIASILLVGAALLCSINLRFWRHDSPNGAGGETEPATIPFTKDAGQVAINPSPPAKTPEQKATPVGLVHSINAQTGPFSCVAFSPDCQRALAAGPGPDFALQLWDLKKGEEIGRLKGHPAEVLGLAFSLDGKRALSGHRDGPSNGTVCLWDLEGRRLLRELKGHRGWVSGVAFVPDGPCALSGGNDTSLFLWNLEKGNSIKELRSHIGPVGGVALSRFGRYAASSGWDKTIRVWDLREAIRRDEPREMHIYRGHADAVPTVMFSHHGHFLLSGSHDTTVRLWDVQSEKQLRCFRGHTGPVNSVDLTPNCQWALSGSEDHTVRLWAVDAQEEVHCFKEHADGVIAVAFRPDGLQAVSAGKDGTFCVWQLPPEDQRKKRSEQKP
jgi:WD40 repeat protein/tRNA A-37 threonylcarbamoyl transferase component Bud32